MKTHSEIQESIPSRKLRKTRLKNAFKHICDKDLFILMDYPITPASNLGYLATPPPPPLLQGQFFMGANLFIGTP